MSNEKPRVAAYGSWKSPITSELIVAQSIGLSDVQIDGNDVYWIESRPQEGGRNVVVRWAADGPGTDLNPAPFNVRTRVHEYGGGAWTVADGDLYFSNDGPSGDNDVPPDRRLYRLARASNAPEPITPLGKWRYADGLIDRPRGRWVGVRQDHTASDKEPVNAIIEIDLSHPGTSAGKVLASGHDFFSSPSLSPDGKRLAWLAWNHPNMPWVSTLLYVADLDAAGSPTGAPRLVAGGDAESIFQPQWSPDGASLLFVSDRSGWWNLYLFEIATSQTRPLAPMSAEFGQPQWNFGMSTYAFTGSGLIVVSYILDGLGKLATLDMTSGKLAPIDTPYEDFSSVRAAGDRLVFRGGASIIPPSIVLADLASGKLRVLKKSTAVADDPELSRYFSRVQPVAFNTAGGKQAFGLYYPPLNPLYTGPDGQSPPLVVKCHGGPTAAASGTLSLGIQYWTSRGIAVLDVNYGGSTGYGREYRQRLNLTWGIVDVEDCINGAKYLAERKLIDPERAIITGGSAGGYTTLAALTFHDYFRGGASYYGVSDAAVLARDTHKFESRYLDWLIGPYPQEKARYEARSPVLHVDKVTRPVIFFQGDEDAVVPPNQTEVMVDAMRSRGIPVGYILFAGEQHGFRKGENIRRSLDAELTFYSVLVFKVGLAF